MKSNRIQINLSDDVLEKIDDYAKKVGLSRSSTISVLCSESLMQKDTVNMFKEMLAYIEENKEK